LSSACSRHPRTHATARTRRTRRHTTPPKQARADEFGLGDDPEAAAEAAEARGEDGAGAGSSGKFAWSNSDREYSYDELLGEWPWPRM
jgi:hypothetical protein